MRPQHTVLSVLDALPAGPTTAPRWENALTAATLLGLVIFALAIPVNDLSPVWAVLGALLVWSPLPLRWRHPLPVLVAVASIETIGIGLLSDARPGTTTVPLATMLALYTVAGRCPALQTAIAATTTAVVQLGVSLLIHPSAHDWLYANWAVVAAVTGLLTKERRDRMAAAERRADIAERTRAAEAERQVTAERLRIARELHDVLAHHLAVINAQAGVAEYLLDSDPSAAAEALHGITANSLAALGELRATLGLLRTDGEAGSDGSRSPAPGAAEIDDLLRVFTSAGVVVHRTETGKRVTLAPAAELAYYRVVQEALTNATKHAPGCHVEVTITWTAREVTIGIDNAIDGSLPPTAGGYGLIGMRERTLAADGNLTAGADGGMFRVRAVLPVPAR